MSGLFKGFGSVVLAGLAGSCLAAASFLVIEALMPNPGCANFWVELMDARPKLSTHQPQQEISRKHGSVKTQSHPV